MIDSATQEAIAVIREHAEALRFAHTLNGAWPASEESARCEYHDLLDLCDRLRGISAPSASAPGCIKPDTDKQVFFYEQNFYVLSNFSAFTLVWKGIRFDTSEAAYHWEKFPDEPGIRDQIIAAPSAHEAYTLARSQKALRRPDWNQVKVDVMRDILREKVRQHVYVRRKLLATGDRELIEDSWRDDFWGWGPARDGRNMLGRLWMEVRQELRPVNSPEGVMP